MRLTVMGFNVEYFIHHKYYPKLNTVVWTLDYNREVGGWVGGWVGRGEAGGLNVVLDSMGEWVGEWVGDQKYYP